MCCICTAHQRLLGPGQLLLAVAVLLLCNAESCLLGMHLLSQLMGLLHQAGLLTQLSLQCLFVSLH